MLSYKCLALMYAHDLGMKRTGSERQCPQWTSIVLCMAAWTQTLTHAVDLPERSFLVSSFPSPNWVSKIHFFLAESSPSFPLHWTPWSIPYLWTAKSNSYTVLNVAHPCSGGTAGRRLSDMDAGCHSLDWSFLCRARPGIECWYTSVHLRYGVQGVTWDQGS